MDKGHGVSEETIGVLLVVWVAAVRVFDITGVIHLARLLLRGPRAHQPDSRWASP
jgi:hypothetical protein